jgi:hypothetical protein
LRILRFEGVAAVAGEMVSKDGEPVGTMSSSAAAVGLALLKRGVEPGDVVTVGERQAVVAEVPGD